MKLTVNNVLKNQFFSPDMCNACMQRGTWVQVCKDDLAVPGLVRPLCSRHMFIQTNYLKFKL